MGLHEQHIRDAARLLLDARARGVRLAQLPHALRPRDSAHAEAICEAMAAGFERPLGGWKIGCIDPRAPTKLGLEGPFCGRIPARLIYRSGAHLPWRELMRPVVEAEIALRLARDLPARSTPWSREDIAAAVDAALPAIEIPESRLQDDHALGWLGMVADQGYAGRLICGSGIAGWRGLDLAGQAVTLRIDGQEVAHGSGARAMGHPLDALVWLANHRSRRGDGLEAGQIVSTGSLTGIHWTRPGAHVVAEYPGLGQVEVVLDP